MHLGAVAAVGLKGTLGHRTVLIRESLPYGQVLSIADSVQIRQSPPFRGLATPPWHCARPFDHFDRFDHRLDRYVQHAPRKLPSRTASCDESSASLISPLHMHSISVVKSR
jgi:hypothetical protein